MPSLIAAAETAAIRLEFEQYRQRVWRAVEQHLQGQRRRNERLTWFDCVMPECCGTLGLDPGGNLVCGDCAAPRQSSLVLALDDPSAVRREYEEFRDSVWSTIQSAAAYSMRWRNEDLSFDCLQPDCRGTLHLDGSHSLHCTHCDPPNQEGCVGRHAHPCPSGCGHSLTVDPNGDVRCVHCDGLSADDNTGPLPAEVPFPTLLEIEDYLGVDFDRSYGPDFGEAVDVYLNEGPEPALRVALLAIRDHIPQSLHLHHDPEAEPAFVRCYPCPVSRGISALFLDRDGGLYCDDPDCAVNGMRLVPVAA